MYAVNIDGLLISKGVWLLNRMGSCFLALLIGILLLTGVAFANDGTAENKRVLTVDGSGVYEEELMYIMGMNSGGNEMMLRLALAQMSLDDRREIAKQVGEALAVVKAAKDMGLQLTPRIAYEIKWAANRTLMSAYMEQISKKWDLSEGAVRNYFKAHPDEFVMAEAVHVRHILVDTEAEADALYLSLTSGADFSAAAAEKSKDDASAQNGGDMGWLERGLIPTVLSDALFVNRKGIIKPVESEAGWHVFEVVDIRKARPMTWDEAKEEAFQRLQRQNMAKALESVRNKSSITIDDAVLENLGGIPVPKAAQ